MTTDVENVVGQLGRSGLRPSDRQWEIVREAGSDAVPALLALAVDVDVLSQPEPASLGPVHALRLLGELAPPDPADIQRLLRTTPPSSELSEQAAYIWWQELPQVVARWGKAGYDAAQAVYLDMEAGSEQRAVSAEAMGFAPEFDPTLRTDAIAFFRERLATESDPYVMAHVVEALANLRAWKTYEYVMEAYKRGAVDKETISAADARQRLLSDKPNPVLACLHHTLTERYDSHGPFSPEQRQAMAQQHRAGR